MLRNEGSSDVLLFLASPSDMQTDRPIVLDEARALSDHCTARGDPSIRITRWPEDIGAGAGEYAQSVINKQSRTFEIFVALIGCRMGTPTPRANSGTEEEFDRSIELVYRGNPVQILLFFSNMPMCPDNIDPYQLMLVRHFRDKVSSLGVLFHTYNSLDDLRRLFRLSIGKAYDDAVAARVATANHKTTPANPSINCKRERVSLGNIHLTKGIAPQWASYRAIPLAAYRGASVTLGGEIQSFSPHFRVGFKYADSREPIFSTGSVQTPGQNVFVHLGKNENSDIWFLTAYRAGIRLDPDLPLGRLDVSGPISFSLEVGSAGVVKLKVGGDTVFETFFQIDSIPVITIVAWGDEHDFECNLFNVQLEVSREI
jgi:hypothetical protein